MELSKKLKEQGWHLTEDGIKRLSNESTDVRKIIAVALDLDFRDIASGALPTKRTEDTLAGQIVLQVQKVRNISAPKSNEDSKAAPRFLQLELSDGQNTIQALELENVPALSLNVPPGTKIFFSAERLQLLQGYLVLRASEIKVLGGRVEALVEKWELARAMQQYARNGRRISGASGPPPWIAFGKKIEGLKESLPLERNFKSLQSANEKDKEGKENEEFNAMRSEAIAEATKAGAKKVFGGGGQQILDHNVKKILEKGFSEDEAKQALRTTNNNLERALYNLKRRQDFRRPDEGTRSSGGGSRGAASNGRELGGKRGIATAKEEAAAAKPATNVSLFDFLTDKLPTGTEATTTTNSNSQQPTASNMHVSTYSTNSKFDKSKSENSKSTFNSNRANEANNTRPKFENNISSSFAANRSSGSTSRGGGRSGDYTERNNYNANERAGNSRYSNSGSGRGGRDGGSRGGGRGGASGNRNPSYEESGSRNFASSTRGGDSERTRSNASSNFAAGARSSNNNRSSHERSTGPQETSGGYDNKRTGGSERSRGGAERYANVNDNRGYEKNRYNQRENTSKYYIDNRSQQNNNNNATVNATTTEIGHFNPNSGTEHAGNMQKLVESTSKLKITKEREQGGNGRQQQQQQQRNQRSSYTSQPQHPPKQYSQSQLPPTSSQQASVSINSQQYPSTASVPQASTPQQYVSVNPAAAAAAVVAAQQLPPSPSQAAYTQLPNGFSYDPSKIIGFQNKEANEFALTLLKSQGLNANAVLPQPAGTLPPLQPQQQQPAMSTAAVAVTQPLHTYLPAASPLPPSPYGTPATATYVLPSPPLPQTPLVASQYGMMPGDAWMWKIGDLCWAKYWDDGRYYEAEITGVSDKTCVVFFLGYGNHEEVLKSDCLPITDANHRPINSYTQVQQPMLPPQHQGIQTHGFQRGGSGGGSQRYRGERQMYVPPHKRDN